jgi:hypothetical protein
VGELAHGASLLAILYLASAFRIICCMAASGKSCRGCGHRGAAVDDPKETSLFIPP